MANTLRQPTLDTIGLGSVLEIFKNGALPANTDDLVSAVFGPAGDRGSMVISGANGIVGAGKMMQFGSRLVDFEVPMVALDFPGAPDGLGKQYAGLTRAFGKAGADRIMGNIIRLSYDGKTLPKELANLKPRFLLEAIPEILEAKRGHYELFRRQFSDIAIRSVTSGFPSKELGVGIAHPAFPHEINKIFEIVEDEPSDITKLLWALGLQPMRVSDDWSFVLDVLFCGLMNSAIRYHEASNMPYWKIDKFVRRRLGPNPFRAHDAIGAKGANFLTWSCLHHLGEQYGGLFTPAESLVEGKETGQNWYPPNHFRPLVDWSLNGEDALDFDSWLLGPLFQMTGIMVQESRSHLAQLNFIGEACAQFRNGLPALMRSFGADRVVELVEQYHGIYPEATQTSWDAKVLDKLDTPEWQQLYVNAEHDGTVGVITLGRESYNHDVNDELNRAIDWLKGEKIDRVIVSHDFHLATQLVGADTSEFYPALEDESAGFAVSNEWSKTARRLHEDFEVSVGFVGGKRCLGGMLELLLHCHYLVALEESQLGFPEVTLPVIPGMEGCHWPFRKTDHGNWPKLLELLLTGRPVTGSNAVGWLTDATGGLDECLKSAWDLAANGGRKQITEIGLSNVSTAIPKLSSADEKTEQARQAIVECVTASCQASIGEALNIQSKHSAGFMIEELCLRGVVGVEFAKTMKV